MFRTYLLYKLVEVVWVRSIWKVKHGQELSVWELGRDKPLLNIGGCSSVALPTSVIVNALVKKWLFLTRPNHKSGSTLLWWKMPSIYQPPMNLAATPDWSQEIHSLPWVPLGCFPKVTEMFSGSERPKRQGESFPFRFFIVWSPDLCLWITNRPSSCY